MQREKNQIKTKICEQSGRTVAGRAYYGLSKSKQQKLVCVTATDSKTKCSAVCLFVCSFQNTTQRNIMQHNATQHKQRTVVVDKIPALEDKSLDDPVKGRILVPGGLFVPKKFSRAKLTKILAGLGTISRKQFHLDPSEVGCRTPGSVSSPQRDFEKDDGIPPLNGGHDVGIGSHDHYSI